MNNTNDYNPMLEPVDDGLEMRETGPWAQEKLDFVRRYLEAFTTSMKYKKWRALNYIDIFSGPGKCKNRDTQDFMLGSPLNSILIKNKFDNYFFCDFDLNAINTLKKRCENSSEIKKINFTVGDGNKKTINIINMIKEIESKRVDGLWSSTLNLAFLDPEGFELEWNTVKQLASLRKMDLIIYYPHMGIEREFPKEADKPSPNKIDKYFGCESWRDIYKTVVSTGKKKTQLHRALLDLYKENLIKLGYLNLKTHEPCFTNKKNAKLYRLFFASKDKLAIKLWNDIANKDYYGQKGLPLDI